MILADKVILAWNTEDKIRYDFVTYEKTNKIPSSSQKEYVTVPSLEWMLRMLELGF